MRRAERLGHRAGDNLFWTMSLLGKVPDGRMMGFGKCYSKTRHHGVLHSLSWGIWGKGRSFFFLCFSLPSLPETGPTPYPEERSILISEDKWIPRRIPMNRPCWVSLFMTLTSYALTFHIPPRLSILHQTQHENTQLQLFLRIFISLRRFPFHVKYI